MNFIEFFILHGEIYSADMVEVKKMDATLDGIFTICILYNAKCHMV